MVEAREVPFLVCWIRFCAVVVGILSRSREGSVEREAERARGERVIGSPM